MAGRGHNPAHGYDIGPLPPNFYGTAYPGMPPPPPMAYLPPPAQFQPFQQPIPSAWPGPQAYPPYSATYAAPPPISDGGFPGINLRNHFGPNSPTGGVGLPPGYNYIFPAEHTIIHILSVATKPWQLGSSALPGPHSPLPHTKFYVPVSMNLKEFLGKIGCAEGDGGRTDTVFEVSEKGNGGWAKGLTVSMANKDLMKKSVGDLGWRSNRNGNLSRNGQPVVWLWKAEDAPPR